MFIIDLARVHGETLKCFVVGEAQFTLNDIECLCSMLPNLETLVCSVTRADIVSFCLFFLIKKVDYPCVAINRGGNTPCQKITDFEAASPLDTD